MTKEDLQAKLKELGVKFHHRHGKIKLQEMYDEALGQKAVKEEEKPPYTGKVTEKVIEHEGKKYIKTYDEKGNTLDCKLK